MAQSILEEGTALWLVHPASVFGLYPYSYPSFVPFLLATFSNIMGLEIETVILMTSLSFGATGVLFAYMLGKEFSGNELVAYLTAFCFSLSPIFIEFTSWTTSTRALFVLLLPLILFLVLRYERTRDNRYLFLTLLFLLVEASVHLHFKFKFRESRIIPSIDKRLVWLILLVFFVFFLLQFSNFDFFRGNQYTYRTGFFFTAGSVEDWMQGSLSKPILFLNMCIDYASSSGILFFFFPITLVIWLNKIKNREYKFEELFFLIISLMFSCFMIYHWHLDITEDQKAWMQDNTYHAAKFIEQNSMDDCVMSSNMLLRRRIISNSYVPAFPLWRPQLLVYDYIDKDKLNAKFQIEPSLNTDYFWVTDTPTHTKGDWAILISSESSSFPYTLIEDDDRRYNLLPCNYNNIHKYNCHP